MGEHDSLKVTKNGTKWVWHAKGTGGKSPIELIMELEDLDTGAAINKLAAFAEGTTSSDIIQNKPKSEKEIETFEKKEFILPEKWKDNRRTFAYLTKTRYLDPEIVNHCIEGGLIYEDKNFHNAVFVGQKDETGKAKHASLRGTYTSAEKPFKGDVTGSNKDYSFALEGKSDQVIVYESAIDALSHASIEKEQWLEPHRITQGGMSDRPLQVYLKKHPEIKEITFFLDNDFDALDKNGDPDNHGQKRAAALLEKYKLLGYIVNNLVSKGKDVNEDLKNMRTKGLHVILPGKQTKQQGIEVRPVQKEQPENAKNDIFARLEEGVKSIFTSENYLEYLKVMSKFHTYSVNNCILIKMQMPEATRVAGYQAWKNNFKRQVKKDSKGISVLAPSQYKVKDKVKETDPVTGTQVEKEVERTVNKFRNVTVFDISQTEGKELPTLTKELDFGVEKTEMFIAAIKNIAMKDGISLSFEKIYGGAKGYFSHLKSKIAIKEGMEDSQIIKTAIHELAHSKLHIPMKNKTEKQTRSSQEVEAESIGISLNGSQRMEILHDIYRNGKEGTFNQETISQSRRTGRAAKNIISPMAIEFKRDHIVMDEKYAQVIYLREYPTFLNDKILGELTNFRFNMLLSINIKPIAPDKAHKLVMGRITSMESDKMDLNRKANKNGQLEAFIPYQLRTMLSEAQELLEDIVNRDQKLFLTTIAIVHMADSKEILDRQYEAISQVAMKNLFQIDKLLWQQEEGLNIVLPYGINNMKIDRCLTTESVGGFIPFESSNIFQKKGIYYGQNALNRNIIAINRKKLKTPSGFVVGTPGSGKSFKEKQELLSILLGTDDDVIIIDPEREYTELVRAFGGEVIHISAASHNFINPLDLTESYSDDENGSHDPLLVKSDFIISLFEVLIGGKIGLTPVEISIIDRCTKLSYRKLFDNNFDVTYMPILEDLYNIIKEQPEKEAARIASALELYVHGTLKVFSNKTNVEVNNRLVCYDTKDLGKNLKTAGMLIVVDAVWNRITANRESGKRTWLPIDEIQVFFSNGLLEAYFDEIWRRFRKWGGIPTGITQNVTPLLSSKIAYNMLQNSEFVVMLNQAPQDKGELAKMFGISDSQLAYITNAAEGNGLICAGGNIIPFSDVFPKDTQLYRMMTTKIEEINVQSDRKTWAV